MVRGLVGFAGLALVGILALKLLGWIFGIAISLVWMLLVAAFWGFILYLILRIFAPGLADRMREFFRGKPASTV